jgi:hypothetical protein
MAFPCQLFPKLGVSSVAKKKIGVGVGVGIRVLGVATKVVPVGILVVALMVTVRVGVFDMAGVTEIVCVTARVRVNETVILGAAVLVRIGIANDAGD